MRCPSCNHDNSADALFCDACGAKFESLCATCGTTNQPGARFCKECGTRIAMESVPARPAAASTAFAICVTSEQPDASTPLDGERKTVTALFADIKGSTELMEELDPEEARAIIDPALKLMIEAVRRYDGYVVQSTGDGIFALFGAPLAHEDHPQRALYAALRMQEDLKRYSARLREAGNLPIEGRVGVNTGEVVVRSITTGEGQTEYTPIGHTTNLASRMQALAPTGSIAVSEQTRKFVEGYFQLKPLGPTKVKGVSEPVNVHEVTGLGPLRTRLQRAVGRGLTKFVGREREMETLRHAAELAKSGHGQIVAAMAEPGVGKSRLYYEFKATSQFGWMVLETFSISHGKASAYLPVIDLLRNYFRIAGEDDERTRREKVAGKITILDRSLDDTLPYLFSLLGIVEGDDPLAQMDGQIKKRRTLEAIKRILLRESLNQPLMVIFEDLHWIDEATQELLNLLADSIGTAKFLLLVNYRPEYSHKWNSKTYYTQLRLDPLGKESADEMLSALLGASPAPATQSAGASRERPAGDLQVAGRVRVQDELAGLKRMIIDRTEGNPFFMEEIVQSLFEDGVLHRNGAIRLARSMNAVKVPATVQGVLAARTDRLPAEEKELLQTLAVRGREFPLGLVRRVTLKPDDELERRRSRLQAGEFIYEQAAAGDVEYTFKHALTQEVAYNALLIERRKLLHERAGAALESLHTERLDDHFEELAHHYSSSDNIPKAVEYLRLASEQALKRSHHSEAITRAAAGLHLLGSLPEGGHRWEAELSLQLTLGYASMPALGYAAPEVGNAFDRAATLSRQVGTGKQTFAVIGGLWAFYLVRADQRRSHEFASELLEIALKEGSDVFAIDAHFALGVNLFWEGKFAESLKHLERGFVSRPDLSLVNIVGADTPAFSLGYAACCLWHLGFPKRLSKHLIAHFSARMLSNIPTPQR